MHAKKTFQKKNQTKNHAKPTKQKICPKKALQPLLFPQNARTALKKSIIKIIDSNQRSGHGPKPVGVQEAFGQCS